MHVSKHRAQACMSKISVVRPHEGESDRTTALCVVVMLAVQQPAECTAAQGWFASRFAC